MPTGIKFIVAVLLNGIVKVDEFAWVVQITNSAVTYQIITRFAESIDSAKISVRPGYLPLA